MDTYFFNGTYQGMAYHAEIHRQGGDRFWTPYKVDVKCFNNKSGNCSISFTRNVLIRTFSEPKKAVRKAFTTAKQEGCL